MVGDGGRDSIGEGNPDVPVVGEDPGSGKLEVSIRNVGAVEWMGEVGGVMGVGIFRG
jgi:hypothetical protein